MNYISQIRAFYELLGVRQFSAGQIALWHALMDRCNRSCWQEWFTVSSRWLELNSGLSRQGVHNARKALQEAGLIDFAPQGVKATAYSIKYLGATKLGGTPPPQSGPFPLGSRSSAQGAEPGVLQGKDDNALHQQTTLQRGVHDAVLTGGALIKQKRKQKESPYGDEKKFTPPEVEDVKAYCEMRENNLDAEYFVDFYQSKGWMVGRNSMRDWKAAVRNWERSRKENGDGKPQSARGGQVAKGEREDEAAPERNLRGVTRL